MYHIRPQLLSFVLNVMINSLPTPDMLRLWTMCVESACYLCKSTPCTIHHILANCPTALFGKRYSWRHDSVLLTLQPYIVAKIRHHNKKPLSLTPLPLKSSFVRPGAPYKSQGLKKRASKLADGDDWRVLIDYDDNPIVFPPEITISNERPDIIIWSVKLKHVILFELTCGAEEGAKNAVLRKTRRYNKDLIPAILKANWTCTFRTMEVCARGMVAHSTRHCLQLLGFSFSNAMRICQELSHTVARCSYTIWASRKIAFWDRSRALLTPNVSRCKHIITALSTSSSTLELSDSDSDDLQNLESRYAALKRTRSRNRQRVQVSSILPSSTPVTKSSHKPPSVSPTKTTTTTSTTSLIIASDHDMSDLSDLESLDLNARIPPYECHPTITTTTTNTTSSHSVESKHSPSHMSDFPADDNHDAYENDLAEEMGAWDDWS